MAGNPITCDSVIQACNKALAAKDKQIQLSDLAITQQHNEIESLKGQVAEKDAALGKIYRNPYVLIGLGVLVGVWIKK